jgi:GAF domain-containing protein
MILYANAAAAKLLSAGGGAGASLRTSVFRDERRRFDALFEAGRQGPISAEIRLRGRKGGRPVNLSLRPIADRGDVMLAAVLTDLAEQKKTEEALEAERLARSILEQAGEPILVCDTKGLIIRASRSATRIVGRDPLFQSFKAVLPLRAIDDGKPYPPRRQGPTPARGLEVHFERPDGASFRLILNADPLRTPAALVGTIITLTDVTRLREAEETREKLLAELEQSNEELAAIESLSLAGLTLHTSDQLAHSLVSKVGATMKADEASLLLARGDRLDLVASVPPVQSQQQFSIEIGTGFAGAIAKLRRTLVVPDVRSGTIVKREELRQRVGSLLGVPLLADDELVGVLHVGWRDRLEPNVAQERFLEIMAQRAATVLLAQRLKDELGVLYEQQREAASLNDALARVEDTVHSSLEFSQVMQAALREGAEVIGAETAAVSLHDEQAERFTVAYVHNFPPETIGTVAPDAVERHGVEALRSGRTLAISDTHDDRRVEREQMDRWGIKSVICAPLVVRDNPVAVAFYNYHTATHRFSRAEIDFVRRLAATLSSALENASLYDDQRRVATTLQENFVHPLPTIKGLDLGVISQPASEPELLGGDLSEVFVVDDSHVVVLIGDVAGKGVQAAGLTETVRSTVRTLAVIDPSPAFILGKANELLRRYESDEQHVTAFCAVIDPNTGHVSFASAGHPPPGPSRRIWLSVPRYVLRPAVGHLGAHLRRRPRNAQRGGLPGVLHRRSHRGQQGRRALRRGTTAGDGRRPPWSFGARGRPGST